VPRVAVLRHQLGLPSEPFVLEQARAFTRWEPVLVGRDEVGDDLGLPTVTLAGRSGRFAAARHTAGAGSAALTRILREERIDAVLAHFGVEGSCALPATRRAGIPLATVFHGFDVTVSRSALLRSRKVSWSTYVRRMPALARHGELFLPVSDQLRERLLQRGFPAERTLTHHLGIEVSKFPAVATAPAPRTIVHVGRLVEKKGHDHLLRAMELLPADVRLTCVGDGPLRAALEARAAALGARVRFLGNLDNPGTLAEIARASVLCLPSVTARSGDQEGLGQVLLEAAVLGRPVVASHSGGIPSAVRHGVTGTLVPPGDAPALAAALTRYLDDPVLARTTGSAGRAHVLATFDTTRRTARLEELLDGVVRR
jgi:glycosyltransferase involved in cell wall biosynthesis